MEPDRELLEEAIGGAATFSTPIDSGGYTRSRAWHVGTADGALFVKEAADDGSLSMLRCEATVYREVTGPFLPAFVGFADGGDRALLAIELLEGAHWPPPYPEDVSPLFEALELVAASPPPPDLPVQRRRRSRWEQVASDPGPFLGLGLCSVRVARGRARCAARRGGPGRLPRERPRAQRRLQRKRRVHSEGCGARRLGSGGARLALDRRRAGAAERAGRSRSASDARLPGRGGVRGRASPGTSRSRRRRRSRTGPSPASTLREDMAGDLAHALRWAAELLEPPASRQLTERMFYPVGMRAEYRLEPCKSAFNPVRGMPFNWSLNPYMGCVHQVHVLLRARTSSSAPTGPPTTATARSIRVKTNVAEVLRRELARASWEGEIGRARHRDGPVPAGRGPLPAHARAASRRWPTRTTRSRSSLAAR